ncbi:MAG: hypothetical protein V1749_08135 [Candidatus Desantisbacteria bacterium]
MLSSFATMLGSVIAGYLWDTFGSSVPFLLSAVVSLIVGIIFIFMITTQREEVTTEIQRRIKPQIMQML